MDRRTVRILAPLAALALIHAAVRYIADPRAIDGLIRPLMAVWFAGLGATYALIWVGHDLGMRWLPMFGIASAVGFLLDNLGVLSAHPTPPGMTALNWIGLGLGLSLSVLGFALRE